MRWWLRKCRWLLAFNSFPDSRGVAETRLRMRENRFQFLSGFQWLHNRDDVHGVVFYVFQFLSGFQMLKRLPSWVKEAEVSFQFLSGFQIDIVVVDYNTEALEFFQFLSGFQLIKLLFWEE